MTVAAAQPQPSAVAVATRTLSAVFHEGSQVWVPILEKVKSTAGGAETTKQRKLWRRGVVQVR